MSRPRAVTAFVTGASGFIGTALVRVLVARGHDVYGLSPSLEAAQQVRRLGARVVIGDLREPGPWQDAAQAEWVFHLPPYLGCGPTMTRKTAAAIAQTRLAIDANLLDAVAVSSTKRIVYVADAGVYGATGARPITEDEPLRASDWSRCLGPALDRLDGYLVSGVPIVMGMPAWVYGNGSWCRERVIDPILRGRPVLQVGSTGPWVSPIHVDDCARALAHLAEHGEIGSRYFLVNDDPVRLYEFAAIFAHLANRPLRVRRVAAATAWLVSGVVFDDYRQADRVYSNMRLRASGFRLSYPTVEEGLRQVIGELDVR